MKKLLNAFVIHMRLNAFAIRMLLNAFAIHMRLNAFAIRFSSKITFLLMKILCGKVE